MKICHCVKLTPQEKTAIETTQTILREMLEDNMIYTDFTRATGGDLDDLIGWFNEVVQYLNNIGE